MTKPSSAGRMLMLPRGASRIRPADFCGEVASPIAWLIPHR
ncbi:zinc finger domain-containing protein [uncultured Rothia sp.]